MCARSGPALRWAATLAGSWWPYVPFARSIRLHAETFPRLLRSSPPQGLGAAASKAAPTAPLVTTGRVTMKPWLAAVTVAALASTIATTSAVAQTRSLYDRPGGQPAITAVVDDFVKNVAADKRINKFFANTNIDRLKARLVEQICQGTGGPCTYTGRDMKTAHAGMGIKGKDFNALVQDLGKSLNKFKVPPREQKELVAILAPMKKDIVTR